MSLRVCFSTLSFKTATYLFSRPNGTDNQPLISQILRHEKLSNFKLTNFILSNFISPNFLRLRGQMRSYEAIRGQISYTSEGGQFINQNNALDLSYWETNCQGQLRSLTVEKRSKKLVKLINLVSFQQNYFHVHWKKNTHDKKSLVKTWKTRLFTVNF